MKKGVTASIGGVIMIALGVVLWLITAGHTEWGAWGSGDSLGVSYMIIGAVLIIFGAVLLVVNLTRKDEKGSQ